ncbi:MAG: flagellar basal body-associated FliL family protein [Candidatus Gastranaerophilales bacterium]|nr:flagellar basal body-associated FliL family protein [Candidatus Gastranaerophilales bacterium]
MANPSRPRDAKPKAEDEDFEIKQTTTVDKPQSGANLITTIIVVAIAAVVIIATNYVMMNMQMSQMSKKITEISANANEETGDEGESVAAERGVIIDLGEFILNLSDTNARKFLKVNVAIELSKKDSDIAAAGGGHGEGAPDPMANIEAEMNQFKPSIRDSIISVLSSKTSEELATTPGKELAKEQIKEAIDAIFEGDREVLRVSFGSFFIQ